MNYYTTKALALILLLGSVTLVEGIGMSDQIPDDPKPKVIVSKPKKPKPVVHPELEYRHPEQSPRHPELDSGS